MKIAVRTLLAAAALATIVRLPAQEAKRTLSLDEAIAVALTENPAMKAAEFEEKAATQERRAAIGLRMPKISVMGAYAYMSKDIGFDFNEMKGPAKELAGQILGSGLIPPEMIPSINGLLNPLMNADWFLKVQDQSLGFVGGQVSVPIWLGGKINAANRAARINERTAEEQGNQNRNALVSELVERFEFKMAEAERELQNARLQVETIASALNNTLGQQAEVLPVTTMFVLGNLEDVAYYKDLAAKFNPLLSQVALKRQLAKEGVRLQRANFLPQVAAMGGASFYNYQVTKIMPRWAVGVGVNLKIFDGLNREYKYSAAKQTVKQVEVLEMKAGKDIAVLIEKLYNQMNNYANQMKSIDASLAFAEEYLKAKNAAFLEGMSSSSDLVDAELNLAKVRTERMQTAYNYDVALAKLLEAAGISDEFISYLHRTDARPIHFDKE